LDTFAVAGYALHPADCQRSARGNNTKKREQDRIAGRKQSRRSGTQGGMCMKCAGWVLALVMGSLAVPLEAQQISREELVFLTPEWDGERFADGRPRVADDILERMRLVTLEEAWAVL